MVIGDLVKRIASPDRPTGAKEDLHIALAERDGLPHDHRKKQQRKRDDKRDGDPFTPARPRYRVERKDPAAHWVVGTLIGKNTQHASRTHIPLRGS